MKTLSLLRLLVVAAAMAVAIAPASSAAELAGVTLPDTLTASGKTLRLNGLGLRKKAIFKVYVGGLYLETPSHDPAAILRSDAAKAVRLHFVRDVSKDQLTGAFAEGFEANAKDAADRQKANVERLYALVSDMKEGDELTLVYVPAAGTAIFKGSNQLGSIDGNDFAAALFAIWLGPAPPSPGLKTGMPGL
jgi:hypothetical protein